METWRVRRAGPGRRHRGVVRACVQGNVAVAEGVEGPCGGRCSKRGWLCSRRWDCLPGYGPDAGRGRGGCCRQQRYGRLTKMIEGGVGRRGTGICCPGKYRGHMAHVQAWVEFVRLHVAKEPPITHRPAPVRVASSSCIITATAVRTPACHISRTSARCNTPWTTLSPRASRRSLAWYVIACPHHESSADLGQSGIAFAVSCSPEVRLRE